MQPSVQILFAANGVSCVQPGNCESLNGAATASREALLHICGAVGTEVGLGACQGRDR